MASPSVISIAPAGNKLHIEISVNVDRTNKEVPQIVLFGHPFHLGNAKNQYLKVILGGSERQLELTAPSATCRNTTTGDLGVGEICTVSFDQDLAPGEPGLLSLGLYHHDPVFADDPLSAAAFDATLSSSLGEITTFFNAANEPIMQVKSSGIKLRAIDIAGEIVADGIELFLLKAMQRQVGGSK